MEKLFFYPLFSSERMVTSSFPLKSVPQPYREIVPLNADNRRVRHHKGKYLTKCYMIPVDLPELELNLSKLDVTLG
jgi:hypothetical protein